MKFLLSGKRLAKPPPQPAAELGVVRHDTFLGNLCGWADCSCPGFERAVTRSQAKAARTWGESQAVLFPKEYVTCAHCGHGNVWHTESKPQSPKLRQMHQEFRWSFQRMQPPRGGEKGKGGMDVQDVVEGDEGNSAMDEKHEENEEAGAGKGHEKMGGDEGVQVREVCVEGNDGWEVEGDEVGDELLEKMKREFDAHRSKAGDAVRGEESGKKKEQEKAKGEAEEGEGSSLDMDELKRVMKASVEAGRVAASGSSDRELSRVVSTIEADLGDSTACSVVEAGSAAEDLSMSSSGLATETYVVSKAISDELDAVEEGLCQDLEDAGLGTSQSVKSGLLGDEPPIKEPLSRESITVSQKLGQDTSTSSTLVTAPSMSASHENDRNQDKTCRNREDLSMGGSPATDAIQQISSAPRMTAEALEEAAAVIRSLEAASDSDSEDAMYDPDTAVFLVKETIDGFKTRARPVSILLTRSSEEEDDFGEGVSGSGRRRSFAIETEEGNEVDLDEDEQESLSLPARLPIMLTRKVSVDTSTNAAARQGARLSFDEKNFQAGGRRKKSHSDGEDESDSKQVLMI